MAPASLGVMHHAPDLTLFQEVLIVLAAMTVVIPIFHRLRMSPVFGFLLIGMVLGPTAIGAVLARTPGLEWVVLSDRERIGALAEFGVVLLLFMIGLELSFERLKLMRRLVLGLGGLQVVLCFAALAGLLMLLGLPSPAALVLGLALALSSTAVTIQVLSSERRMNTTTGRVSFAILLFQDIAVVPILFAVSILAAAGEGGAQAAIAPRLVLSLAQAGLAVILVIVAGRLLLRPLFRSVAATQSPELFMAACLLVVFGAALATAQAGLSMAMGALLAGLLLAETEYRRQIEVLIEPFKGLLLGVFLISMGMTLDLGLIAAAPALVLALSLGLLIVKGAVTFALARVMGVAPRPAWQSALLIAPGGEFSFVVLAAASGAGLIEPRIGALALAVTALTMAATPLLSSLGRASMGASRAVAPEDLAPPEAERDAAPRILIAGFGRVGRVVAEMLRAHDLPFIAIDKDPALVAQARKDGFPAYFGDATNPDLLRRCGLAEARALVITMDPAGAELVLRAGRAERADLTIVARARDARHAGRLYAAGATDAVPENVEAALLLSETLLVGVGVPMGPVIASIHDRRAAFRDEILAQAPEAKLPRRRRVPGPAQAD